MGETTAGRESGSLNQVDERGKKKELSRKEEETPRGKPLSSLRGSYGPRDQQVPKTNPQPPSTRRSSYVGDDRDYDSPYPISFGPHGSKSPYRSLPGSRLISRRDSLIHQPYPGVFLGLVLLDLCPSQCQRRQRQHRDYDRDRDGRRHVYSERRRARSHPYPTPRHSLHPILHGVAQGLRHKITSTMDSMMTVRRVRLGQVTADTAIRDPQIVLVPRPHVNHQM